MSELARLRFIPFRRSDLLQMCLHDAGITAPLRTDLTAAWTIIEAHFRAEFADIKDRMKSSYAPLDPDSDMRTVASSAIGGDKPAPLAPAIESMLQRANYERATEAEVRQAFATESLFHIKLYVDFDDFEEVLLYYRGSRPAQEQVKRWFGLKKVQIDFTLLERVVVYIRFKEDIDVDSTLGGCRPGSTMLKLFQNVPDADAEMLFPNTRVMMQPRDKWMIGIPALITGGLTFSTKLGATLVLLGSLFGFWFGVHSEPVELGRTEVLVLLAGIATLVTYFWKQFSKFRKRKLKYTEALTRNLYFKLLDNNTGVLLRLLDEAEDSECKECLLAYSYLLQAAEPISAAELDSRIEAWLAKDWECRIDFEVNDALAKLQHLGLVQQEGGFWSLANGKESVCD